MKLLHLSCGFSQQQLYTAECSHCPPRSKAFHASGNLHADIFLITSHNTKAEIKPYLSVIKQPLIVISAALQLLPLLLKPRAWRKILSLHHNLSVKNNTVCFASWNYSMFSQNALCLKKGLKEVGLSQPNYRNFKKERHSTFYQGICGLATGASREFAS